MNGLPTIADRSVTNDGAGATGERGVSGVVTIVLMSSIINPITTSALQRRACIS